MPIVKIRRGKKVNLPTLNVGELAFTLDTNELFIGGEDTNIQFAKQVDVESKVGVDKFSIIHNEDGSFRTGIINDADVSNSANIQASKLAIRKNYKKKSIANPSPEANKDGVVNNLTPVNGFSALVPMAMDIVFGGTFSNETVTAKIVITYSDSTTLTVARTATSTETVTVNQTVSFTSTDMMELIKDEVYITKVAVSSQSNIDKSAATVILNHYGLYL